MNRKRIILILGIAAFVFQVSCGKHLPGPDQGIIVGWNYGYCATCGGFYLNLSADTTRNANTFYAINYSSSLNDIVDQFFKDYSSNQRPIYVYVSYTKLSVIAPGEPATWLHINYIGAR